jgi:hypothetical protein
LDSDRAAEEEEGVESHQREGNPARAVLGVVDGELSVVGDGKGDEDGVWTAMGNLKV